MDGTALGDLKVVEYASFVAGPYCAKLLADMGADVVKIEEPGSGDLSRAHGPFPDRLPHAERSGLFLYVNTNKRGVTLDLTDPAGYRLFQALVCEADVFVQDRSPKEAKELGVDYDSLKGLNPRLIVTSITPFGQTGPYADFKAYDLNISHSGVEGYAVPGGLGHKMFPDRPPLRLGGYATDYSAGLNAAAGTMMAVLAREIYGVGQHVDLSRQETELAMNRVSMVTYFAEGKVVSRDTRNYPFGGTFPTRDGEVIIRPTENGHWGALARVMGKPELADDPRFKNRPDRTNNSGALNAIVAEWASQHSKGEIFDLCRTGGCPAAIYADAQEVMESPEVRSRGFFQEVDHSVAGRWEYPTAPYQFSETPWSVRRPSPLLGEHNRQVFEGRLGLSSQDMARLKANKVI